jgi:hypothetical protein
MHDRLRRRRQPVIGSGDGNGHACSAPATAATKALVTAVATSDQ